MILLYNVVNYYILKNKEIKNIMNLELIKTIVFTILMGVLPLLSILNTFATSQLPNKDITGKCIGLTMSALLVLPAMIILLSCIN